MNENYPFSTQEQITIAELGFYPVATNAENKILLTHPDGYEILMYVNPDERPDSTIVTMPVILPPDKLLSRTRIFLGCSITDKKVKAFLKINFLTMDDRSLQLPGRVYLGKDFQLFRDHSERCELYRFNQEIVFYSNGRYKIFVKETGLNIAVLLEAIKRLRGGEEISTCFIPRDEVGIVLPPKIWG